MLNRRVIVLATLIILAYIPVSAQGHVVMFDGFTFSLAEELALNVNIWGPPGDSVNVFPEEVPHTQFLLYNQLPAPESMFDAAGGVRVYRTADFVDFAEQEKRLQQLQSILDERPELSEYMIDEDVALPFLPVFPAAQSIRARAHYIDTPAIAGIAFVTDYDQIQEPFLSNDLFYTFQGLSADGAYYVSANFSLTTDLLPDEITPDFNIDAFAETFQDYLMETATLLEQAAPDAFSPPLTMLDAFMQSFAFSG